MGELLVGMTAEVVPVSAEVDISTGGRFAWITGSETQIGSTAGIWVGDEAASRDVESG